MGMRREVHGKQSSERELNPGVQGKPQKKTGKPIDQETAQEGITNALTKDKRTDGAYLYTEG